MARSRGSDMPQRLSPKGPSQVRTSSSDSDTSHHRPATDRSWKLLGDRRSPSSTQSDASSQKKLGGRIADLESRLGEAQEELKCLKEQLASAEAAKKAAQELLEKTPAKNQESNKNKSSTGEKLRNEELDSLRAKLEEKEKELEKFSQENKSLNLQLSEKSLEVSSAKAKEEGVTLKFNQVVKELETTKNSAASINEKLEATEKAKEELEAEMRKLQVQTDQWRKAADEAAAVLAGAVEMKEGRIPERCGSMEKHYFGSYLGSIEESEDSGSGKRKSSGIKMFDLWKKKSQK